ncbi:SDR family NAD(P)-dependent oxidoreductase [Sinisalibacter aestuarii]|uniref:Dehydrogenase n=1 Tax=Sinisalibacter aestuarii TaxID=2949426 RepID=A0ABQ5LRW2_9RHOB|nr:SDR family oxidoreductase [Sinisalibacter aestuarii]GKY87747.1 dehydrogenase [Sinisalibacter aestuarii]
MNGPSSNRSIVITGGAGGIGRATARAFLELGNAVTLIDINADALEDARSELAGLGKVVAHQSGLENVSACRTALEAAGGPAHALIHLAGIYEHDPFSEDESDVWPRAIQSNLTNAYDLARVFGTFHIADPTARLVLASSLAFRKGVHDRIAYSAAKGGIVGLVRALSRKLAPNVLVNAVAPGLIATRMTTDVIALRGEKLVADIPLQRAGAASEVAAVIRFLCGPDASYITGQTLNVDGGVVSS